MYRHERERSETLRAALRAHKKGSHAEALDLYREQLEQDPACVDSLMNLGALLVLAGRAQDAVEAFTKAGEFAPTDGRVWRDIGIGLWGVGRLAEAARALERSVACSPELVGSWLHLARLRLDVAPHLAREAAERAVALRPDDPSAWFMLARTTYADSAPEPALEALRRAESCSAPHPEATLFRLLLTPFDLANLKQSQNEREQELLLLGRAHPRLAALADAAQHLHTELGAARRMASTRTLLELAATHAPEVGSFVELGVFHGTSLRWLAPFRTGNLHGFDSFQGLPAGWDSVPEGRFTTRGRVPEDVPARFWVGSFEEQLPRFVASSPDPIALLHVDSDLYESARSGLQHLGPLLRPGSILVFDEYFGHHGWRQDEHRAFNEATRAHGWSVEPLAVNPFTGQAAFRLL